MTWWRRCATGPPAGPADGWPMDESVLNGALDALYGGARDDFVAERDRRVKELKAAGQRGEAQALKVARKPTVPAWAVDQLARRRPDAIARLLDVGQRLRNAQRRATSGRGADELRTGTQELRALVRDLTGDAADILTRVGTSPATHTDDIERTLFTAAVTPEHHDTLRRGIFDRPLAAAGFGGVEGLLVAPPPAGDDGQQPTGQRRDAGHTTDARGEQADEQRRREEERRRAQERRRLERQQRDLESSRADQQRRVDRAEDKTAQLRGRLERAETVADEERDELGRIEAEMSAVAEQLDTYSE